jgi:quercetin dioxygenase-like cupin family protein
VKTSGTTFYPANSFFQAGGEPQTLPAGASIWLPRGIAHVWANLTTAEAKLLLVCRPGGFEKFFEEMRNEMEKVDSPGLKTR